MNLFKSIAIFSRGTIAVLVVCIIAVVSSCDKDEADPDPLDENNGSTSSQFLEVEVDTTVLKNFPIIDVHQHIYSSSSLWEPGFKNVLFRHYATNIDHYEALVQRMHQNNVVLAISGGPLAAVDFYFNNYTENNSLFWYSAEYSSIDEERENSVLSDLRNSITQQHIKSIGELTGVCAGVPLHDSIYLKIYAIADSFSIPVFIHTGIVPENIIRNYANYGYEYSNPANLKPFLEMYPEVNFNAAHFGISNDDAYNFEDAVIDMMAEYNNFYVDIGATIWWDEPGKEISEAFIKRAIDQGVEEKILFGSDEMV